MANIELDRVSKVYVDGTIAVSELSIDVGDGEFVVLVGPSGCGKTTALRMVAGLEDISSGEVRIDGQVVNRMPPRDRDVAMVFQNYALYPHMSVEDNIGFGLKLRKVPKDEIRRRVRNAAEILGITEYLPRKPRALSGGQRQRVAMGRAIVREPKAFLMDEPLSNLDAKLRVQTRSEILRIQRRLDVTTLYVTHDQVEAMTMGDRVAVMRRGLLQQIDAPQVLYGHPANLFVAGFIGSPAMNLLEGRLDGDGGDLAVVVGPHRLPLPRSVVDGHDGLAARRGGPIVVGFRPEDLEDERVASGTEASATIEVTVDLVEELGAETLVHFTVDVPPLRTPDARELAADAGDVDADAGRASTTEVVARVSPRSQLRAGDIARLAVDTSRAYFFEPESGAAIGRGSRPVAVTNPIP